MKNNDFFIEDGILKKYKGSDENVIIPDGVVKIGFQAFRGCKKNKKGHLPSIP